MAKPVYKFGPFSVNPQARLLFRGGERVSLPPKAADLLLVLLEHDGELVTTGWRGSTLLFLSC